MKTDLTVAAYIFRRDEQRLLLIHHRKLNKWLPVGGHIEDNETPDDAVRRETREEVGLEIKLLQYSSIPNEGNVLEKCALPFDSNVHSVGDHNHHCFFYLCEAVNPEQLEINHELKKHRWYSRLDITKREVPIDVRNIANAAFELYRTTAFFRGS